MSPDPDSIGRVIKDDSGLCGGQEDAGEFVVASCGAAGIPSRQKHRFDLDEGLWSAPPYFAQAALTPRRNYNSDDDDDDDGGGGGGGGDDESIAPRVCCQLTVSPPLPRRRPCEVPARSQRAPSSAYELACGQFVVSAGTGVAARALSEVKAAAAPSSPAIFLSMCSLLPAR